MNIIAFLTFLTFCFESMLAYFSTSFVPIFNSMILLNTFLVRTLLVSLMFIHSSSCIALSDQLGSGKWEDNVLIRAKVSPSMVGLDELDLKEALEDKIAKSFTQKKMKI